jgi:hypothetical protein
MIRKSETGSSSQITSSLAGALLWLLLASANCAIMLDQNHFAEPNQHVDFSSSNFNVQGHILSTAGDALSVGLITFLSHSNRCYTTDKRRVEVFYCSCCSSAECISERYSG